jgi:hypothetical protein
MLDSSFVASQDPESRHQEIKIGWMLFIPSFLLISVPFAFVFVYSLCHLRRDDVCEPQSRRRLRRKHVHRIHGPRRTLAVEVVSNRHSAA